MLPFKNSYIRLQSVLLIPGLGYYLVLVGRPADNGIQSLFRQRYVVLRHASDDFFVVTGNRDKETRLYRLPNPVSAFKCERSTALINKDLSTLRHKRLSHLNVNSMRKLYKIVD